MFSFGAILRQHRRRADLSIRKFADQIMYSAGHVSHIETGKKPPTVKFAQICERVLGLPGQLVPLVPFAPSGFGPPPAQLPSDGGLFVGRENHLRRLAAVLQDGGRIALVDGPPGVGKTALAVRCASSPAVSGRFPDGVLFADLHGLAPARSPANPADVAADFLRALGVPLEYISAGETACAAMLRSVLASRRMLVVLDNAATADQLRPLLPGGNLCGVLVTSRRRLSGLTIRDGATRISLGPLDQDEAIALLTRIIGHRTRAEPERTAELARLCSYWPLALRVIGERAATLESSSLAELCAELNDLRLDVLSAAAEEDRTAAVRTVFAPSYQALRPDEAATFRLLGLHYGSDISLAAVSALIGRTTTEARAHMRRLCQAHLVTEHRRDRYRLYDLVGIYAAERLDDEHAEAERNAATTRLLEYLATALPGLREAGDWQGEVDALVSSGDARWRLGHHRRAHVCWHEALRVLHDHGATEQATAVAARVERLTATAAPTPAEVSD